MTMGLDPFERLLAFLATLSDRLLGTHLSERLVARYDARITSLRQELETIEAARARLDDNVEALVLSTCAVLLMGLGRSPDGGILFEPGVEREGLLQTSINMMVKPGLATIREHARPDGQFAYEVFPRWVEICDRLSNLVERIESQEAAAHVRQNIEQIQSALK
jgi:hypothetical protein